MQKYSRHGQLIDSVQCTSVFVYANRESTTDYSTQAFTLIEFRQCKRKGNSMKMQPRKLKIMLLKALWDFVKVWGPRGSIPCFPSPPPPLLSVGLLIRTRLKCYNLFTAPTQPTVSLSYSDSIVIQCWLHKWPHLLVQTCTRTQASNLLNSQGHWISK